MNDVVSNMTTLGAGELERKKRDEANKAVSGYRK